MKIDKDYIIHFFLLCVIAILCYFTYELHERTENQVAQIEQIKIDNEDEKTKTFIHYEQEIEVLSKLNRQLYDSIRVYKDQIDFLVQFKYEKEYKTRKSIYRYNKRNNNKRRQYR